jgi:metal-responsive CopG/Arc/MetJ family transcriptional regulator
MAHIKTAISLQKPLFDELDTLARQMKVSRSRLLALALEEFIRRRENQQLLEKMNQAYENTPDDAELTRLRKMRYLHRKVVEGEW